MCLALHYIQLGVKPPACVYFLTSNRIVSDTCNQICIDIQYLIVRYLFQFFYFPNMLTADFKHMTSCVLEVLFFGFRSSQSVEIWWKKYIIVSLYSLKIKNDRFFFFLLPDNFIESLSILCTLIFTNIFIFSHLSDV